MKYFLITRSSNVEIGREETGAYSVAEAKENFVNEWLETVDDNVIIGDNPDFLDENATREEVETFLNTSEGNEYAESIVLGSSLGLEKEVVEDGEE